VITIGNALNSELIKELNLKHSSISEKVASNLALAISNQYYLEEFAIQGTNLGINGIITVIKSLSTISKLKLINIDNTSLTEEAADVIVQAISSNRGLEQLYLGNSKLRTGGIKVAKALRGLSRLRILDLNDSGMNADVADELASAVISNSSLEDLRLKSNKLTTRGVVKIAKSLSCISTLKVLNIRHNQVTEEAADALSSAISNNTYMEYLWLSNNNLQAGVLKILRALETLPKLKALDIENNHIPEGLYDNLASFLQCSNIIRNLRTLYFDCSDLHLSGVKIAEALCHLTSLRILDLSGVNMKSDMADKLADAIPNMTLLEQLWLKNNNLGTDGVIKIVQSLSTLTTLIQLSLAGNQTTEEATDAIVSAIHTNNRLEKLYLSDNDLRVGVLPIVNSLKMF